MVTSVNRGLHWYLARQGVSEELVCATRDMFQARLDSMYRAILGAGADANEVALLTAIVGEIGNNCFDHNLGRWRDVAGCWFAHEAEDGQWIVVADRGQGILSSLQSVAPELDSHQAALDAAFRKQISGRAPEQRGNGLKFVRRVINGNAQRGLLCLSGDGSIGFGGTASTLESEIKRLTQRPDNQGTCFLIRWSQ